MRITPGTRLGPYEILALLGAGGMGEVWKARDTRLNRIVAIKISKIEFSARFEREARAVAALNHPHISTLYDIGPNYLVMEFVEGKPLAGPMPGKQAVEQAIQILDALDCAHRNGVIHRDLKPANILVTRQGIKLLDFGLARQTSRPLENDATITDALTAKGHIVGTLQYMAPEQLHGRDADARSDIFAFGCVLYEMLTGRRAFDGASAASLIAAILDHEPVPLANKQPLERVIRKCLAKDPEERFQSARDLKTVLLWSLDQQAMAVASRSSRKGVAAAVAIVAALGSWAIARRWPRPPSPEPSIARFTIALPDNTTFLDGKVSPDGRWFAFIGADATGVSRLWLRKLDSIAAQPLGPAEFPPFWSTDSRYMAYGHGGKLMKIEISGVAPQAICDAPLVIGGSWNRDQTIIFSGTVGGAPEIFSVSAQGGAPKRVTRLDASHKDTQHVFPAFLPDGRRFLYTVQSAKRENGGIYVGSLDSPDMRMRLLPEISSAEYAPSSEADSGYLVFARGEVLMAQRVAARDLQFRGDAVPVAPRIARSPSSPHVGFSVSETGVLLTTNAYFGDQLTWFDRAGKRLGTVGEPGLHFYPRLSPDGRTLVADALEPETFSGQVWLFRLDRTGSTRFSFIPSLRPIWAADGSSIVFEAQGTALYRKSAAGAESETLVLEAANVLNGQRLPCDCTRNGQFLIYSQADPKTGFDLWMLPLAGKASPISLLQTEFNEWCGALSSDGRWIAYASDESGRSEIYVQAFSAAGVSGRKWQVSYEGGSWPKWRKDGRELFYIAANKAIVSVEVESRGSFHSAAPRALFVAGAYSSPDASFDVTADGSRLILPAPISASRSQAPEVILNWTRAIGR